MVMEDNRMQAIDYELLGRVLDSKADEPTRRMVMLNLANPQFKEYFMIALKASRLFDYKVDVYGTIL